MAVCSISKWYAALHDYMTKPFSPRELMARVKAHLRREDMDVDLATMEIGLHTVLHSSPHSEIRHVVGSR